jgi:hypothetical protein
MTDTATRTEMPEDLKAVPILVEVHTKAQEVDAAKEHWTALVNECNMLALEAVDAGEPYRDIAAAAGRSLGWVQTALAALNVEGPRVRRRPARLREAKEAQKAAKAATKETVAVE